MIVTIWLYRMTVVTRMAAVLRWETQQGLDGKLRVTPMPDKLWSAVHGMEGSNCGGSRR